MSRAGATARVWYTVSMPACRASTGLLKTTLLAVQQDLALVRLSAPDRHLISVDLPAPLSPMMASTSPGYSLRLTPARPTTWPNVFTSPRASSVGVPDMAAPPGRPRVGWRASTSMLIGVPS